MYESERTAYDLLRKELQQLKQELNKTKSEVEVAKAVAVANETSSRRLDVVLAVSIHLIYIHTRISFKRCAWFSALHNVTNLYIRNIFTQNK